MVLANPSHAFLPSVRISTHNKYRHHKESQTCYFSLVSHLLLCQAELLCRLLAAFSVRPAARPQAFLCVRVCVCVCARARMGLCLHVMLFHIHFSAIPQALCEKETQRRQRM
jgi:hypothetical protein